MTDWYPWEVHPVWEEKQRRRIGWSLGEKLEGEEGGGNFDWDIKPTNQPTKSITTSWKSTIPIFSSLYLCEFVILGKQLHPPLDHLVRSHLKGWKGYSLLLFNECSLVGKSHRHRHPGIHPERKNHSHMGAGFREDWLSTRMNSGMWFRSDSWGLTLGQVLILNCSRIWTDLGLEAQIYSIPVPSDSTKGWVVGC